MLLKTIIFLFYKERNNFEFIEEKKQCSNSKSNGTLSLFAFSNKIQISVSHKKIYFNKKLHPNWSRWSFVLLYDPSEFIIFIAVIYISRLTGRHIRLVRVMILTTFTLEHRRLKKIHQWIIVIWRHKRINCYSLLPVQRWEIYYNIKFIWWLV